MFNLSQIPSDARIDSVRFEIKLNQTDLPEIGPNTVTANTVSSNWTETGINWGNRPPYMTVPFGGNIELWSSDTKWISFESNDTKTTTFVKENMLLSIKVEAWYSLIRPGLTVFFSRESGNAPKLVVTFTIIKEPPYLERALFLVSIFSIAIVSLAYILLKEKSSRGQKTLDKWTNALWVWDKTLPNQHST
jgi:hypothetical protein